MEAHGVRKRWSYEEYARLPVSGTTRYEVVAGELVVTPSPTGRHQVIVGNLILRLGGHVQAHALGQVIPGPIDVLFAEGDYFQPDLIFIRADRMHTMSERGVEAPPDLVVEIASPSTAKRDRGVKLARYRHFGVPEYWVVDPALRQVEVWRLAAGAETAEVFGVGDRMTWQPDAGAPVLEMEVTDLLPGG